jgi:hypothetical protein
MRCEARVFFEGNDAECWRCMSDELIYEGHPDFNHWWRDSRED